MSGANRDTSAEFERPQLSFEREFGQYRNWWARDKRIVGNAFSLLLYLLSHDRGFRITQRKAQADLGLGKDAFLVARRKLEHAGYLAVRESRFPAGSVDESGRPIGGHRQLVFRVQDPQRPTKDASEDYPRKPAGQEKSRQANAEKPTPGIPSPGIPPLKKTNREEEQSSSDPRRKGGTARHDADDDDSQSSNVQSRGTERGVNLNRLQQRLARVLPSPISNADLSRAVDLILSRAPRAVTDPTAYVAGAIERTPDKYLLASRAAIALPHDRNRRPLTVAECNAQGHQIVSGCCIRCGTTLLSSEVRSETHQ